MLYLVPTLLAGFVFNFSKIFCDWAFEAELMMKIVYADVVQAVRRGREYGQGRVGGMFFENLAERPHVWSNNLLGLETKISLNKKELA